SGGPGRPELDAAGQQLDPAAHGVCVRPVVAAGAERQHRLARRADRARLVLPRRVHFLATLCHTCPVPCVRNLLPFFIICQGTPTLCHARTRPGRPNPALSWWTDVLYMKVAREEPQTLSD